MKLVTSKRIPHISPYIWWFLFTGILLYYVIFIAIPRINEIILEPVITPTKPTNGYSIRTPGCKILEFPITNDAIEKYFHYKYNGTHCNHDVPPLVDSNFTSLFLLDKSFDKYLISEPSELDCCYDELIRKTPNEEQSDNLFKFQKNCLQFNASIRVTEEFVRVRCNYKKKLIYTDFFSFVQQKPIKQTNNEQLKFNVVVYGIDGISRINFHRQMPKFAKTLKKMEFEEFYGYNKIADNTYPNLITVLTGHDEATIDKMCKKDTQHFDNCSIIWDQFKAKNYVTAFSEDSSSMGIFNFWRKGFRKQPTDYYWSWFDRIAEDQIGNAKDWSVIQCIGPREGYRLIMQYVYNFIYHMKEWHLPYFSFSWSASLSHDYVNKPRIGDQQYVDLVNDMYDRRFFEDTVMIFMSDHGLRYGDFRETYQGAIEERLPFLFIRLPKSFRSVFTSASRNFKINTKRLTTPYDLHQTLYDLTRLNTLTNEVIDKSERSYSSSMGLSLFRPVPPTRTCEDAGIAAHWCTCLESQPLKITDEIIQLSTFAVGYMNDLLEGYTQCATLQLKNVTSAHELSHVEQTLIKKTVVRDVLINFETVPGNGYFEATVRKGHEGKLEILGTISRLNKYGNQSGCITDFHLKLYCYCKSVL